MWHTDSKRFIYMIVLAVVSLTATIICAVNSYSLPASFDNLVYLPLGNTFATLIFVAALVRGNFYLDMPVFVISTLFTMRNAVTPMVMSVTTCASRLGIYPDSGMVNIGITVFLYETVAVYFFLFLIRNKPSNMRKWFVPSWRVPEGTFAIVLTSGVLASILCFVLLPELRTQYYTIFTNDITHLIQQTTNYGGGIKRALSTSANMIIEATRLTLSSFLIFKLRAYKECWYTYLACVSVILIQFFFMNDSNAYVIMIAFSLYMLVYKLFPRYGKVTLRYLVLIVITFFVLIYINRFSQDIYGQSASVFLQAYLPGLNNFATIEPLLDRSIWDAFSQIFIDLYGGVPFRSTLLGYQGGLDVLPTLWQKSADLLGQIMPNVAQSYYYFGPFLCPILSIVLCYIGVISFKKANMTLNPCLYTAFIYLCLYTCVSITMYDFYIFFKMFLSRFLFMYIFSCFCKEQMPLDMSNRI